MKNAAFATALVVLAPFLSAETFRCGTGTTAAERESRVARVHELRARNGVAANATPSVEVRNGFVLVDATEDSAPFRKPFDLGGRSLRFSPAGGDAYTVTNLPLVTPDARGVELTPAGNPKISNYRLQHFSFPIGGRLLTDVILGADFAIHTQPLQATLTQLLQYDALEAATEGGPLIAPLINPKFRGSVQLFVNDTPTALTVTWTDTRTYDIRATLLPDGTITFSYLPPPLNPDNTPTLFGAPAVVTGSVYDRTDLTTLASSTDALDDVPLALRATTRPAVDFTAATLRRLGDSDLLRLDVDLAGALPKVPTSIGSRIIYSVDVGGVERAHVTILDFNYAALGVATRAVGFELQNSNALRIDGTRMTIWLTEEMLGLAGVKPVITINAVVFDGRQWDADTMSLTANYTPAAQRLERDLSAAASTQRAPIAESFTLPALSVTRVWADVRNALQWDEYEWDGVMIFQNFDTDIGLDGTTAYATYGFSSAEGIGLGGFDDSPTLMHVNRLKRRVPAFDVVQNHILLHEFAHRWLFSLDIAPGAQGWDMLSPDGAHPAQWVDTRAAFQVHGTDACSSMGGAFFTETGAGKYKAGTRGSYGYSWLDLYGMGLAAASEVPASFYLEATAPALQFAYWAPAGIEVAGTRRPITMQEIVGELGPRIPAYPDAKKKFRVAFVLVREPERPVTAAELAVLKWERDTFIREFSTQTGGRGSVESLPSARKRRAARH